MQAATRELEGKSISYKNELLYSRGIDYDQLSNEIYTAGLVKPGPLLFFVAGCRCTSLSDPGQS